jgi:hypothetical protein
LHFVRQRATIPVSQLEVATAAAWRSGATGASSLKRLSRAQVVGLVVVVVVASFNITIPARKSAASNWRFVLTHPTILLHVVAATAVLVVAVVALIASLRSRDRSWVTLSAAGLAFVLMAFVAGDEYVMSLQKIALNYMSVGWAGAVVIYGIGWYLGRKKERRPAVDARQT